MDSLLEFDQFMHGLLDLGSLVESMNVEQVDWTSTEILNAPLTHLSTVLGRAVDQDRVLAILITLSAKAKFGSQEDVFAPLWMGFEPVPDQLFVVSIPGGGVPERIPELPGSVKDFEAFLVWSAA